MILLTCTWPRKELPITDFTKKSSILSSCLLTECVSNMSPYILTANKGGRIEALIHKEEKRAEQQRKWKTLLPS